MPVEKAFSTYAIENPSTALTEDDLFVIINAPGGTPQTQAIPVPNAFTARTAAGAWIFSGTARFTNTGLLVLDTGGDHTLNFKANENLSANRTLNIITGDADRSITLAGSPTLNDWFDQSVKVAATPQFARAGFGVGADATAAIYTTGLYKQSIGSADPFTVPEQVSPFTIYHGVAADVTDNNTGNLFVSSSYVINDGSRNSVAVFGYGRGDGATSAVWGGNFVAYANFSGAVAQGIEINYGNLVVGGVATGLAVNVSGGNPANVGIQLSTTSAGSVVGTGIRFLYNDSLGQQPVSGSLIDVAVIGAVNLSATNGIDFTLATFSGAAIKTIGFTVDPSGDLLLAAGNFINFGSTIGSTGYGFWDDGGTLKWKNSGGSWSAFGAGGGDALTTNPLSQFAATTSAQLAGVISDETGSGLLVFATSPTLVTPALGTPSALVLTNATGLPPVTGIVGWPANASGVLTNNGSGTLSWGAAGGGLTWSEVTGTTQAAAVDNGYVANNAAQVVFTIPTTAAVGKIVRVVGKGAGGWRISQNAGETIHFGNLSTTTGTGGFIASTHRRDSVELICVVADTEWEVISSQGNITVT